MELSLIVCPNCGAPLPTHAIKTVVTCKHCNASVARGIHDVHAVKFKKALERAQREIPASEHDVIVGGRRFALEGRIGRGESSEVFLAREARRTSTTVLVKILRSEADADLLEHEYRMLGELSNSAAPDAPFLSMFLPQPVHAGPASFCGKSLGYATVYRASAGFVPTLEDLRAAYPKGVDPRHAVWIYKRVLGLLGFVHSSGWVHGAILPQHIVLHAEGHAAMLIGFSCAVHTGERARARCESRRAFYPPRVQSGASLTADVDIIMAARSIAYALGANDDFVLPRSVPFALSKLLARHADDDFADGGRGIASLVADVSAAALEAFGPPKFERLELPEPST